MLMLQVLANTPNKAPTPMPGHSTSINTNPLHTGSSCKAGKTQNHACIIENKAPNIESETVYKLKFPCFTAHSNKVSLNSFNARTINYKNPITLMMQRSRNMNL